MRILFTLIISLISLSFASAQGVVGIKTNLLYGAAAYAPNLGVEIATGRNSTIDISAGYNGWNIDNSKNSSNKKLAHTLIYPEFRIYTCERFRGHFFGLHGLYTMYNIGGYNLNLIFGDRSNNYRFEGNGYGGGVTYGYQFLLSKRLNLELSASGGYTRFEYDKYLYYKCGAKVGDYHKNYLGLTKASISLTYIIK